MVRRLLSAGSMRIASLSLSLSLSLGSAGCVDPAPDEPVPGDPAPVPAHRVTVDTLSAPALVAYREGDGPWQTLRASLPSTFELEARGPYRVTAVCDDGHGNVTVWQLARTPADPLHLVMPCQRDVARVTVSGRMKQRGQVLMDDAVDAASTSDWTFSLDAAWGTHDLIALAGGRVAFRRGIDAKGPGADPIVVLAPPLDLAAEGSDLVPVALTASNATPAEALTAAVRLEVGLARATVYRGAPEAAKAVPAAALAATDAQIASVTALDGASRRIRSRPLAGTDPTPFTLPERLGPVSFSVTEGQLAAAWSTLPPHDLVNLSLIATGDAEQLRFHDLELSPGYITATGARRAAIELAGLPGFRPEWHIDPAAAHERVLSAASFPGREVAISSVREAHGGAAAREADPRALRASLERLR